MEDLAERFDKALNAVDKSDKNNEEEADEDAEIIKHLQGFQEQTKQSM
jgi:hypothetical protein